MALCILRDSKAKYIICDKLSGRGQPQIPLTMISPREDMGVGRGQPYRERAAQCGRLVLVGRGTPFFIGLGSPLLQVNLTFCNPFTATVQMYADLRQALVLCLVPPALVEDSTSIHSQPGFRRGWCCPQLLGLVYWVGSPGLAAHGASSLPTFDFVRSSITSQGQHAAA